MSFFKCYLASITPVPFYRHPYAPPGIIELDGEHHREKVIYKNKNITELEKYLAEIKANERLQDRQYKDKLKNDYAKDNNIPLLRIEYVNGIVELDKWKKLIEEKIKEINFR